MNVTEIRTVWCLQADGSYLYEHCRYINGHLDAVVRTPINTEAEARRLFAEVDAKREAQLNELVIED